MASNAAASGGPSVAEPMPLTPPPDRRSRPTGGLRAFLRKRYTLPVLSVVVFLAIWQIAGASINPILLATPSAVAVAFVQEIVNGELPPAFLESMAALGLGFLIAAVVGIGVGILMGRSLVAYRVINPYVAFFQATPLIGLLPLVVIWTGLDFAPQVTITVILSIWSIIVNTSEGVRNTPPILLDMSKVYRARERSVVWNVALPNAIPYIFAGLRIAVGKALIGVVLAEMEVSLTGLGGIIKNSGDNFQTATLLAGIVTTAIVGVIATVLLELLRRRLAPWAARGNDRTKI